MRRCLRRNIANGTFQDFQERLLHTFTGNIARERNVLGLARDLVDFIDVNDAALSAFDVVISVLQQPQNNVLHVFADVAGFRERGRIRDGKRHI
jgi:hypothetical protein